MTKIQIFIQIFRLISELNWKPIKLFLLNRIQPSKGLILSSKERVGFVAVFLSLGTKLLIQIQILFSDFNSKRVLFN